MIFFSYQSQTFVNYAPTPLKKTIFTKNTYLLPLLLANCHMLKADGRSVAAVPGVCRAPTHAPHTHCQVVKFLICKKYLQRSGSLPTKTPFINNKKFIQKINDVSIFLARHVNFFYYFFQKFKKPKIKNKGIKVCPTFC